MNKLPPLVIAGIVAGVLALAAATYFGLDYLRKEDPYKHIRGQEALKQAGASRTIAPGQVIRGPRVAAAPAVLVNPNTGATTPLITNKVNNAVVPPTNNGVGEVLTVGGDAAPPVSPSTPADVGIVPNNSHFAPKASTNQVTTTAAPPIAIDTPPTTPKKSIEIASAPYSDPSYTPPIPQDILTPVAPSLPVQASTPQSQPDRAAQPQAPKKQIAYAPGHYLFRNLSGSTTGEGFDSTGSTTDKSASINLPTFAPEGEPIDICTVNNVASNQLELDVVAAVWTPFYWNGRQILEVGDHILGSAAAGHNRDRLLVTWKKVVFKDGKTLPINGVALHTDGTLGLKGYKVGNIFLQAVGPMLTDLLSGAAQALQNQVSVTENSLTGTVTNINPNNIGEQAVGYGANKALDRLTNLLEQDAEDNAPYIFVPAGTRGQVLLKSYIDVSLADYGK